MPIQGVHPEKEILMRIKQTRSLLVVLIAALAASLTAPPALAFDEGNGEKIEGDQLKKLRLVIVMTRMAMISQGTMEGELGTGGDNMEYEQPDGGNTSLEDAAKHLKKMLAEGRITIGSPGSKARTCRNPKGVDKDTIVIDEETFDIMCDKSWGASDDISEECEAAEYFLLSVTLMNEIVHVYQKASSSNKKHCDAEHDSDCLSILTINRYIDALTKPDPNNPGQTIPHTSTTDIQNDPDYVPFMKGILDDTGADTPAEIAAILKKLRERLATYTKRKNDLFAAAIAANVNWGPIYRNGWDGKRVSKFSHDAFGTVIEPPDPQLPPVQYQTIPGGQTFQARVYENRFFKRLLVQVNTDPLGQTIVQWFLDTDGDFMPEQPEAVPPAPLPLPIQFGFQEDNFGIYPDYPPQLHPNAPGRGLLFHDQINGILIALPLDDFGLPVAPPQQIIVDPLIDAGGFPYYVGAIGLPSGDLRFVFSDVPESGQSGDVPAIWFDLPGGGGPVVPFVLPGQTLAEANDRFFPIGMTQLVQGQTLVTLGGTVGDTVDLFSAGLGAPALLAGGVVQQDGDTNQLPLPGPLVGPDLFVVTNGVDREFVGFLPEIGTPADTGPSESNLDTDIDRWDLSEDPPRLHFFEGLPPLPGASPNDFIHELLLPSQTARMFGEWDNSTKTLLDPSAEVEIEMSELNLVSADPIVVESDGWHLSMGLAPEPDGVAVIRLAGTNDWQPIFVQDFNVAPIFVFQTPIPALTFIPSHFEVLDIDLTNGNDVVVFEHNGPGRYCYTNDGSGNFTQSFCPAFPCEGDANGDSAIDVNDISYVLFRLGNVGLPGFVDGDANGDGVVDVNDISYVLFRLGDPC
jgi:hypothetical protein